MTQHAEGATSVIEDIFIQDSRRTDGSGLTGLVFNSAGLTCNFHRVNDGSVVAVSLVTMTLGTWASGGFKEIDATAKPGWYSVGIPNAVCAATFLGASMTWFGAANMMPCPLRLEVGDESPFIIV